MAYLDPSYPNRATFVVNILAENGQKAKNKSITSANNNFDGTQIVRRNFDDSLWGINNFPELKNI